MRPSQRHILFVTGEYPPQTGGVGAYTAELGKALIALGWQVSVLTSQRVGPLTPEASGQDATPSITVHPAIHSWGWHIWQTVPHWAKQIGAGWLHVQYQTAAYNMHPAINFTSGLWQRHQVENLPLRVAWTYHDLFVPYLFPKAGDRLRRWVTERPATVNNLTIVTNEGDRQQLATRARRLAKIPIGSNIQGRSVTTTERHRQRKRRGFDDDTLVVGYFGFLNRSKGGTLLVRALKEVSHIVPSVQLLMIGERVGGSDPTNYAYLQEVEALIHQLDLGPRVHWTGHQPDEDVSLDLAACDILLMPYEDGASLRRGTLMAGLAHGCAIITTTPQTPLPELVDGRDLLYIPPGDLHAATAALLRIAQDDALAATLRTNARDKSQLFTWESIARQHATLYVSI